MTQRILQIKRWVSRHRESFALAFDVLALIGLGWAAAVSIVLAEALFGITIYGEITLTALHGEAPFELVGVVYGGICIIFTMVRIVLRWNWLGEKLK